MDAFKQAIQWRKVVFNKYYGPPFAKNKNGPHPESQSL